jgi:ABC-type nitrate/sulfonate/bicarbonate transport system permease component
MSTDVIHSQPATTLSGRWTLPYAALTLVGIVVAWQIASYLFTIPAYLLPSPAAILADMINRWPILLANAWITIFEIVFGFFISVLVGIPLAICVTYSRPLDRAIYPLIVGSQTIPKVAIAPLLLAWFGFGLTPKITIVALVAFFPIVVSSVVGLRSATPQMLHLARSMGASPIQIFWRFRLPNALPSVFAGMKMASVLAVIGAVVAEFVGADSGLGYLIMVAGADFKIDRQFSAIFVLSLIGMSLFWLAGWVERLLLPWHISVRASEGRE